MANGSVNDTNNADPMTTCLFKSKEKLDLLGLVTPQEYSINFEYHDNESDKLMVILYSARLRSPLATHFYQRLARNSKRFNVAIGNFEDPFIKMILSGKQFGKYPDVIFLGFGWKKARLPFDFDMILNEKIPLIAEIGDVNYFHYNKQMSKIISHFYFRMPCGWGNFQKLFKFFKNTKKIQIPWTVPLDIYKDKHLKRNIDVSMICGMNNRIYHQTRNEYKSVLDTLPGNIFTGTAYGKEYINLLQRSKIFIVESSMREALTQKYIEGAACGALLMGDMPFGHDAKKLLKDKVSFIEINNPSELRNKIAYYLNHEKERRNIVENAKARIKKYHDIDLATTKFEDILWNDLYE